MRKLVMELVAQLMLLCTGTVAIGQIGTADAWHFHASLYLYTNSAGANLPSTARMEGFPLLVRLRTETFDFHTAQPHGEDIRFTDATGNALSYNIERWNPSAGEATIWVRIPVIKGAEVQAIHMHWGNASASSESNGAAVFNPTNGYAAVLHMGAEVKDEVGSVNAEKRGVTASSGVIGDACHFAGGQGVFCGEQLESLPSGNSSHSTGCWFRATQSNSTIIGWGNEGGGRGSKIRMQLRSPAHIHIDSDFSDVNGNAKIPANEWVHVEHTYSNGTGRIYINGKLDSEEHPRLNIHSPQRMWVGGWYNNYDFQGDIDEVRLSAVERSADWIRLEYENQKPLQSVVGPPVLDNVAPVSPTLSPTTLVLNEGTATDIKLNAPGARKIDWDVIEADGNVRRIAVNQFVVHLAAGRVSGDAHRTVRVTVQTPSGVAVQSVPVQIREAIPDPDFVLSAPTTWDGRTRLVVKTVLKNSAAMGRANLPGNAVWQTAGPAAAFIPGANSLMLTRAHRAGDLLVSATLSNGGLAVSRSAHIHVRLPELDPPVEPSESVDETPQSGQFYARGPKNTGNIRWCASVDSVRQLQPIAANAEAVFLTVSAPGTPERTVMKPLTGKRRFVLLMPVTAGLTSYRAEYGVSFHGKKMVLGTASDLVCGDAFLIDGQSNAEATAWGPDPLPYTNPYIRSFGATEGLPGGRQKVWGLAATRAQGGKLQIGAWGMEIARRIVEDQHIPVCILNGAVGGTRVDQHQRNASNPEDGDTIYGRLLWRVRQAHLQHGIRAIYWHQGENDQGADGPTGGFGWETYQKLFIQMASAWMEDYPNTRQIYLFQIWPKSCAMGINGSDNQLREVQRSLPGQFAHMSIMSTLGIEPPGGCHYPPAGYAEMARLIFGQTQEFTYAKRTAVPASPPNLQRAWVQQDKPNVIHLKFNQPVIWSADLCSEFLPDGQRGRVTAGKTVGTELELTLSQGGAVPRKLTYLDSANWSQKRLLKGQNGIAALTFCDVTVEQTMQKHATVRR